MKNFAIIGNPVKHSLSPILYNWVFNVLKIKAEYKKIRIIKSELSQIIQKLRSGKIDGINVTIPHKEDIIDFLDDINPRAASIGAVNCLMKSGSKIIGNNTDWFGFTKLLEANRVDPSEREVIVLGAGGASKSILFVLKQLGAKKINLLNRTYEKAQAMQWVTCVLF